MRMTHASVFSGIGGPEVAASMLGWENLFHCEINPFGKAVLDYWYPNAKSYDDITKTDFREWRGRIHVLTGGFPCQPFSYAGKRKGADDDRYLWPHMFRCIDEIRPDWVVAENVAGILTMVEQGEVSSMANQATLFDEADDIRGIYQLRETFTLQRICDDLTSHGYSVQPILIPACAVGAPHRRDRVFIVARRLKDTDLSGRPIRRSGEGSEEYGDGWTAEHASSGRTEMQNDTPRTKEDERGGIRRADGCTSPHPDSHRGCEVDEHLESEQPNGAKPFSDGGERNVADTVRLETERRDATDTENDGSRGETRSAGESSERPHGQSDEQHSVGCCFWHVGPDDPRFAENGIAGQERWQDFPSVSPVHRGNDGLPFDVDNLTIPFPKWRTEALKAYGNAIVPQVMYEIFRAIQEVERLTDL